MRIQVEWYNEEKTILVERFPEEWSWDEFKRLQEIVPPMMRDVPHGVYVIGDFSQRAYIPPGNPIIHARNLMSSYPENFEMLIIITRTGLIESFTRAFMTIFTGSLGTRILIVDSIEEMLDFVEKHPVRQHKE